jgi:hypothetical protein
LLAKVTNIDKHIRRVAILKKKLLTVITSKSPLKEDARGGDG